MTVNPLTNPASFVRISPSAAKSPASTAERKARIGQRVVERPRAYYVVLIALTVPTCLSILVRGVGAHRSVSSGASRCRISSHQASAVSSASIPPRSTSQAPIWSGRRASGSG